MQSFVKWVVSAVLEILLQIFNFVPIKENRIVFISHKQGLQYSDSPKYICEYLIEHYNGKYQLIWIFKEPNKFRDLCKKGIKVVRWGSLKDLYYANTAKLYICNQFGPHPNVIRRKGRIIIETSHGVAYKHLNYGCNDKRTGARFGMKAFSIKMNKVSFALSPCKMMTDLCYRDNLKYEGTIIEEGLPRNDIFFNNNDASVDKVKSYYGIDQNKKIVILMPTWRFDNNKRVYDIDYDYLLNLLHRIDGCDWVFIVRKHHLSNIDLKDIFEHNEGRVYDGSVYLDSQELLLACDLLITDYSSVVWDFSLQKKPILIYVPDKVKYNEEQGFNIPPEQWGLYSADNPKELYEILENHTWNDLEKASELHLHRLGCYETGESTKKICERIDCYCSSSYSDAEEKFIEGLHVNTKHKDLRSKKFRFF